MHDQVVFLLLSLKDRLDLEFYNSVKEFWSDLFFLAALWNLDTNIYKVVSPLNRSQGVLVDKL